MQILTFEVASRRCTVPRSSVFEVTRAVGIAPLPNAAPIIDGVIDLRGTIVPVTDLGQRFGAGPRRLTPDQQFVLVRDRENVVGLRVAPAAGRSPGSRRSPRGSR